MAVNDGKFDVENPHFTLPEVSLHLPWQPQNGGLVSRRFAQFPLLLLLPPNPLVSRVRTIRCCLHLRFSPSPPLLRRRLHPVLSPMCTIGTSSPNEDNPTSSVPRTVRVVIKGRVQGVFYRNWTIDNATELGLNGWVRNRRDGSVEALFSGSSDKVQDMEQRCRRGPPDAIVTGFQVFPSTEDPGIGFDRRPTA